MVARLSAYRLDDSWEYDTSNIIQFPYNTAVSNHTIVRPIGYGLSTLTSLDNTWGLVYRILYGYSSSGLTKAIILAFTENADGESYFIIKNQDNIGGWTNGEPVHTSTCYVQVVTDKSYINPIAQETVDVGEDIIDETLTITRQIESIKKFDLRVSSASLELDETDAIASFMGTYWTADKVSNIYYAIGLEIEGRFWGYVKPENIIYDEETQTYIIEAYDWIKFFQATKWNNFIPSYKEPTLSGFLTDNLVIFSGKSLTIDVGDISQNWDSVDYRGYYRFNNRYTTLNDMTVTNFMVEILKNYSAVIYYDTSGNLVFRNRSKRGAPVHRDRDKIISETLSKTYVLRDYNSLLINVKNWDVPSKTGYEGFVLIWVEDGVLQTSEAIQANLGNLDENKFQYLDLRQDFNGRWYNYLVFGDRTKEQRAEDYGELMFHKPVYELEVDGLGYNLYDTFTITGGVRGRIIYIEEDDQETTRMRVEVYSRITGGAEV